MTLSRGFVLETSVGRSWFSISPDEVSHLDTTTEGANLDNILLFLECWMCLLADSPLNTTHGAKPCRVFSHFKRDLLSRPLRDTIKSYSELSHALVSSIERSDSRNLTVPWIPEFRETPIFKEYHYWYETHDVSVLSFIYTFLVFGKRLDFQDDDLKATAFRGWLDVEKMLSDLDLDGELLAGMRHITKEILPSLPMTPLMPKFGPGAVAEKEVRGKIAKSVSLSYHPRIDRALFSGPFVRDLPGELGFQVDSVTNPTIWNDASKSWSIETSELKFVPKDTTKARSICMEPNTFMWAQQAVLDQVLQGFKLSLIAGRFINIKDQSRNRDLARVGSLTSRVDTIDLSSASDSVSTELVRRLFPKRVLYYLLATRTSKVLTPDGKTVEVKKFAPMGSALCFPVQCMVFASVVIYAAIQHDCGLAVGVPIPLDSPYLKDVRATVDRLFRLDRGGNWRSGRYMPAAIYGDDICVDTLLTPHVMSLLDRLGFTVNRRKSFTGKQAFRESCGGYYLGGVDVTPLYYRVKNHSGSLSPECVASLISCINRAGDRRFSCLRTRLLQYLMTSKIEGVRQVHGRNPFLFSSDRSLSFAIFSTNPRNTHLRSSYNSDWQLDGYHCIMPRSGPRIYPEDDNEIDSLERYLHDQWWHSRYRGEEPAFTAAPRYDTSGSRLRVSWIRAEG